MFIYRQHLQDCRKVNIIIIIIITIIINNDRTQLVKQSSQFIQENIDAKHQYAGKLICHTLLSSL